MKTHLRRLLMTILLAAITTSCFAQGPSKRVLFMVSEGFYAPEYFKPLQAFELAGYEVSTATKYKGIVRPDRRQWGSHPAQVMSDLTFDQIKMEDYDAIVFAGGNGAWEDFFPNGDVHKAITDFMKADKVVALLCSSTGLLGVANNFDGNGIPLAEGRRVTGYKRVAGLLTGLGKVQYLAGEEGKPFVVTDGNLITGRDPMSSELFAKTIIEKLSE